MTSMDNTPDSPAKTPEGYTTQGGNFWTLITPEIWKVLHAVLHAEVLARLLNGERLTSLDAVYEASTTRLGAVKFSLEETHGWNIRATDKAAGCNDGRLAWIVEYHLHPEAIEKAMAAGAGAWCEGVRKARLERRRKAAQAIREAARVNEARRNQRFRPGQRNLFEGSAA